MGLRKRNADGVSYETPRCGYETEASLLRKLKTKTKNENENED